MRILELKKKLISGEYANLVLLITSDYLTNFGRKFFVGNYAVLVQSPLDSGTFGQIFGVSIKRKLLKFY